ncbi:unnamed protein product [Tuber melanosporum]|uniref:(Perigord truffle) hypothetical protein n=1 Tax=Tuber melanosporum (strain Mel28) TaxID=656061 RepID=D5GG87_TUBMM|nr:unnamed protein product [Tuber melanosporum]
MGIEMELHTFRAIAGSKVLNSDGNV